MMPGQLRNTQLADGREIQYALYGSKELSNPILYVHGFPGSRIEASFADRICSEFEITLLAPDRPGFGGSGYKRGFQFVDWPADIRELLQSLGIGRCGVIGASGGAPYALAVACKLPEMVSQVNIVSGVSPIASADVLTRMAWGNRVLLQIAQASPKIGSLIASGICRTWRRYPVSSFWWFHSMMRGNDRIVMKRPELRRLMALNFRAALSQGHKPAAEELIRLSKPWGFSLSEIKVPVSIWHGLDDTYVPSAMARKLAADIPGASLNLRQGFGHLMLLDVMPEVLKNFCLPKVASKFQ